MFSKKKTPRTPKALPWTEVFNTPALTDKVGLAGDWHISEAWAPYAIETLAENGVHLIMHLGDFGFWPVKYGGDSYLFHVSKALEENDSYIAVTLGNHEDYNRVEGFKPVPGMPGCVTPPGFPRILVFARGYRWEWNNNKFLSVSGGQTVDRLRRITGESFWHQELLTDEQVTEIVAGGEADVILSHDSPTGIDAIGSHRLMPQIEAMTRTQRDNLKLIFDAVRPQRHFFGHYHVPYDNVDKIRINGENEFYTTHSVCMDKEYTMNNMGILDTRNLVFKRI